MYITADKAGKGVSSLFNRRWLIMTLACLLVLICLTGCRDQTAALHPAWTYMSDGAVKWGYINAGGRFVIKPAFDEAGDFQPNGLAVVGIGGRKGLIDGGGTFVIKPEFAEIRPFTLGFAVAAIGEARFVVLDERGRTIYESTFPIGDFHDGLAAVRVGSLCGYIGQDGKVAIKPRFREAGSFSDGKALVRLAEGRYALIDKEGAVLASFSCEHVTDYAEGRLVFRGADGSFGYLDEEGKTVIQPRFDWAQPFQHGLAVVGRDDRYGVIDRQGRFVAESEYNEAMVLSKQLIAVGRWSDPEIPYTPVRYALADRNGRLLSDFIYYEIYEVQGGLVPVTDYSASYFVDFSGRRAKGMPVIKGIGRLSWDGKVIKADTDRELAYYGRDGEGIWRAPRARDLGRYRVIEGKFRPNRFLLIHYPQIEGMPQGVQSAVNARLRELAVGDYAEVEPETAMDYSYEGLYSVAWRRRDLLVLEISGYHYGFGAAHGMPVQEYVHLDLARGTFYRLEDLFKPDSDYVGVVGEIIRREIERAPEDSMYFTDQYQGITADQHFILTRDALQVYFYPYEIAPYAAGFPTFEIPYTEIMEIINTQGNLWRAIAGR